MNIFYSDPFVIFLIIYLTILISVNCLYTTEYLRKNLILNKAILKDYELPPVK